MDHNLFLMLPLIRAGQWYQTNNFGIIPLSNKWAISIREINADSQAADACIKKWCNITVHEVCEFLYVVLKHTSHNYWRNTIAKIFM